MKRSQVRVLLVDDDEDDYLVVRGFLEEAAGKTFRLDWVQAYDDARKAIHRGRFDVCLLDYQLGEHNGLELLHEAVTHGCRIPLIMLTGHGCRDVDLKAMQTGAADYLDKHHLTGALLDRSLRYAIERKHVALALQASEERYALAVAGANDGLWDWNLVTDEVYYSPRWKAILGHQAEGLGNSPDEWFSRVHPDDLPRLRSRLEEHLSRKTPHFIVEHRLRHKDETYRWMLGRGVAIHNRRGRATRIAGSLSDITARKSAEERLRHDNLHDALTELPNRTLFIDRLSQVVKWQSRHHESAFAVLFIDIDGFKHINDSIGHLEADKCLVKLARRLESCIRPTDTVSRFGGDEFALLATDIRGDKEAEVFVERIQKEISQPMVVAEHEVATTVSIGVVLGGAPGDDTENLLRKADRAMYVAKGLGPGSHSLHDQKAYTEDAQWPGLVSELKEALAGNLLQLHYQPMVCLKSNKIVGFEGLARWSHPKTGFIAPEKFLPMAERAGLSGELTRWALREAFHQAVTWKNGHSVDSQPEVCVKVHASRLKTPAFVGEVAAAITDAAIHPSRVTLEFPEDELMAQSDASLQNLKEIAALGVQIYLDGFGMGHSSLGCLSGLPVNALKIGQSFVRRLAEDNNHSKVVRGIVALAHDLGMRVIAEGIETRSQFQMTRRELGIDWGQGLFIAPPMESQTALQLLTAHLDRGPSWEWEEEALDGQLVSPSTAHGWQ